MLTIRDYNGNALLSLEIGKGSKRVFSLMKDDYISLKFSLAEPIRFGIGSYVIVDGFGRFELTDLYQPKQNSKTGGWDYDIRFDAHYIKWKNKIFKYTPENASGEASWNLTATLDVHLGIFLRNLVALGYDFNDQPYSFDIDNTVSNTARLVTYENKNLLDSLYEMADKFECEMWVTDSIIHFGRCEFGDAVEFRQDRNVESMTAEGNRQTYATRIYAFGSERNLPKDYRPTAPNITVNGVVQRRLMLPADTPYIDSATGLATVEAVEQVIIFDDIYPRTKSAISDITTKAYNVIDENNNATGETWNAYRFKIPNFEFKEDYILPDNDLQVIFQTGSLAGMTFNVKFNPEGKSESDPSCQLWEIIRNEDYGRPLPDDTLKPADGNEIILIGWDSTKIASLGLVADAEQELKQRAIEKSERLKIDPANYRCKMISASMFDAGGVWHPYSLGDRVTLINQGCFENGIRESRIIGYEYDLAQPYNSPVYVVGEKNNNSRTKELESKVESLTLAGQTYTGGSGSGVYLIRTNDTTPPSDFNAYSAKRTKHDFLSRVDDDTAHNVVKFIKWLEFGNYRAGASGAFLGMTEVGSLGEMDYLKVRKKAQFETLEIAEVRYVGGKLVVSPGDGVEIIAVEELPQSYKCYFKGSETDQYGRETTVSNKFAVGDQIYCKVSNVTDGAFINHYWWRLCTEVGDGWFAVSKNDCDSGSDVPMIGDKCAQLGNRNDMTRQSAIVLSTIEIGHSPLLALYGDINSYSLESKDKVVMGADATGTPYMTVYGKCYIGKRDESTYVKYTPDGGVEIRAKISAESSIGDTNINQYITNTVMGKVADDGFLTPIEKRQLISLLIEIRQEHSDIANKCISDGIEYEDYDSAYWDLLYWLTGETKEPSYLLLENGARLLLEDGGRIELTLGGALSDMTQTTAIDREQWLELLRTYYRERDTLKLNGNLYGSGDYTQTIIDGGLVTTGALELKGASGITHAGITGNEQGGNDDVRIWAGATKAQRSTAPFRVTQAGNLTAHNADIQGEITARSLTLQGASSFIYVTSINDVSIELTDDIPFMACRTIEVWLIKVGDTNPKITFTAKNSNVWIARNFTELPSRDDFINNPNLLSELSTVTVQDKGLFKCFGVNIGDRVIWNIIKYEDSYIRGRQ